MKLVFLGTSFSIIYFMRFHRVVRNTYDKEQDTFRSIFIVVPCAVLALLINQERSVLEVCLPCSSWQGITRSQHSCQINAKHVLPLAAACLSRHMPQQAPNFAFSISDHCWLVPCAHNKLRKCHFISKMIYSTKECFVCWSQILWTFSIYLEAVAILPQLVLLQRTQNIDNLTGNYVFLLG